MAMATYDEALTLFPDQPDFLTGRGFAKYGPDTAGAVADFEKALEAKGRFPSRLWSLFFLAHFSLRQGDYQRGLALADSALLERELPDRMRAQLLEWRAICRSETGGHPERIEADFSLASDLAPDLSTLAANFHTWLESRQQGQVPSWGVQDEGEVTEEFEPTLPLVAA